MPVPRPKVKTVIKTQVPGPDGKPVTVSVGREGISNAARKQAREIARQIGKKGLKASSHTPRGL